MSGGGEFAPCGFMRLGGSRGFAGENTNQRRARRRFSRVRRAEIGRFAAENLRLPWRCVYLANASLLRPARRQRRLDRPREAIRARPQGNFPRRNRLKRQERRTFSPAAPGERATHRHRSQGPHEIPARPSCPGPLLRQAQDEGSWMPPRGQTFPGLAMASLTGRRPHTRTVCSG